MGAKTDIQWTDSTWSPIRGCSRVSSGCKNCYAEQMANRFSKSGEPYEGTITNGKWNGTIKFVEKHLEDPIRWKRPRRVFVNSMSDLFHENIQEEWIDRIFAVMALCPQHQFQVLTKRPERMLEYISHCSTTGRIWSRWMQAGRAKQCLKDKILSTNLPWPLPNVELGTSIEDQKTADERIPFLLQTLAAVRFISAEPLIGPVDLEAAAWNEDASEGIKRLSWCIVGGESGRGARSMNPNWARSLRDQCVNSGVPFFFKQNGEFVEDDPENPKSLHNGWCSPISHVDFVKRQLSYTHENGNAKSPLRLKEDGFVFVSRVGKKLAGRELDGRTWDEMPK